MNKKEIQDIVDKFGDEWYYYYNFDSVEVCKKSKNDKTAGAYNWEDKLKPIIRELSSSVKKPCIFDIGCNMGYYDHEMIKMGIKTYGVDRNIATARFFQRYVIENLKEDWKVDLRKIDVTKDKMPIFQDVNIVTMFCVLYHFRPNIDKVMSNLSYWFPNNKYIVLQGNKPRVKKKKNPQPEAGVKGMKTILKQYGYAIYDVHKWNGYQKPVVIGVR